MLGNAARILSFSAGSAFLSARFASCSWLRLEASSESGLVSSDEAAERETGGLDFDGNCCRGIVLNGNAPVPNTAPMILLEFEPGMEARWKIWTIDTIRPA